MLLGLKFCIRSPISSHLVFFSFSFSFLGTRRGETAVEECSDLFSKRFLFCLFYIPSIDPPPFKSCSYRFVCFSLFLSLSFLFNSFSILSFSFLLPLAFPPSQPASQPASSLLSLSLDRWTDSLVSLHILLYTTHIHIHTSYYIMMI